MCPALRIESLGQQQSLPKDTMSNQFPCEKCRHLPLLTHFSEWCTPCRDRATEITESMTKAMRGRRFARAVDTREQGSEASASGLQ